jgi:hypothetical protein
MLGSASLAGAFSSLVYPKMCNQPAENNTSLTAFPSCSSPSLPGVHAPLQLHPPSLTVATYDYDTGAMMDGIKPLASKESTPLSTHTSLATRELEKSI